MQKIQMLRNLLGVQKLGKPSKHSPDVIFAPTESTFNMGAIQFVGEELSQKFKVGQKIYFGNQREQIRMADMDIMVMKEDNVYATVEEVDEEISEESLPPEA